MLEDGTSVVFKALLACQVGVTVGDPGPYYCVHVTSQFRALTNPCWGKKSAGGPSSPSKHTHTQNGGGWGEVEAMKGRLAKNSEWWTRFGDLALHK